ncbi:uncharacterized protein LOC133901420 [Phragmites australis]|uniref:uncharacterized protein LOC133901420 n=1 Tax=Phragmites australis TaxID=29695 RepID=UPI002D785FE9|nr:uncharacterized protein LOC133901420 [Phragmites australis]
MHQSGHDDSSSDAPLAGSDSEVDLPLLSDGHYRPAVAVASASALQWIPYAEAVCAVLGLVGASHEDLRCRAQQLSRWLSGAAGKPFAAGGARFPEGGLYVCADLPPLGPALQAAQRAIMQVVVRDASHGACY